MWCALCCIKCTHHHKGVSTLGAHSLSVDMHSSLTLECSDNSSNAVQTGTQFSVLSDVPLVLSGMHVCACCCQVLVPTDLFSWRVETMGELHVVQSSVSVQVCTVHHVVDLIPTGGSPMTIT